MRMDPDDLKYLDGKFGEVHTRITKSEQRQIQELHSVTVDQNQKIADLSSKFDVHVAAPCKDVQGHEEKHHAIGWPKVLGVVVVVAGALTGIVALVLQALK